MPVTPELTVTVNVAGALGVTAIVAEVGLNVATFAGTVFGVIVAVPVKPLAANTLTV